MMKDCTLDMANIVCEMAGKPSSCRLCPGRHSGCLTIPKMQKLTSNGYGNILNVIEEIREYLYGDLENQPSDEFISSFDNLLKNIAIKSRKAV